MLSRTGTCFLVFSVPAAMVALSGCTSGGWGGANYRETRTMSLPAVTSAPVTVETANGSIIVSSDTSLTGIECSVEIKANTDERLKAAKVVTEASPEGRLVFRVSWPGDGRVGSEGASFTIRMPSVNSPVLTSSNGSIVLRGATGPAVLKSSNASLTVEDLAGPLTANSSNGSITAKGVAGSIDAQTSNASVEVVDCAPAGDWLRVATSNGSIEVRPSAAFKGVLTLKTSNASVGVWLPDSFAGSIAASTSNAAVTFDDFPNTSQVKEGKTKRSLTFATPGPESSIKTSNGVVKVHRIN